MNSGLKMFCAVVLMGIVIPASARIFVGQGGGERHGGEGDHAYRGEQTDFRNGNRDREQERQQGADRRRQADDRGENRARERQHEGDRADQGRQGDNRGGDRRQDR